MRELRKNNLGAIVYLAGFLAILVILGSGLSWKLDLTEDQRFTLTQSTKEMLTNLDDLIYVKILLEGDFESNFKRLGNETVETLENFQRYTSQIVFDMENPLTGEVETVRATQESLAKDFIFPFTVGSVVQSGRREQQIYPYALFYFGERMVPVNLLEDQVPGVAPEVTLNNSIQLLEYKFANAIQKLKKPRKGNIIFSMGHGELPPESTRSLELAIRQLGYNTGRIDLSRHAKINAELDLLIVARPRAPFSDTTKFKIDQYVMHGGKIKREGVRLKKDSKVAY